MVFQETKFWDTECVLKYSYYVELVCFAREVFFQDVCQLFGCIYIKPFNIFHTIFNFRALEKCIYGVGISTSWELEYRTEIYIKYIYIWKKLEQLKLVTLCQLPYTLERQCYKIFYFYFYFLSSQNDLTHSKWNDDC